MDLSINTNTPSHDNHDFLSIIKQAPQLLSLSFRFNFKSFPIKLPLFKLSQSHPRYPTKSLSFQTSEIKMQFSTIFLVLATALSVSALPQGTTTAEAAAQQSHHMGGHHMGGHHGHHSGSWTHTGTWTGEHHRPTDGAHWDGKKGDFKKGDFKKGDFKKGDFKKGDFKGHKAEESSTTEAAPAASTTA
ncbi:hypothetical protein TWF694_010632 [Orbilia ellipsospora]|uniref:Uncharacterized protein n=1 Tax=Orbilia ellipsospora TaxID=2528407 RepID=A0AAV9XDJ9_9PEZI